MSIVTLELPVETERQLRLQASERGESLETYLRHLAENAAHARSSAFDVLQQGMTWLTNRNSEEIVAARHRILESSTLPRDLPAGKTVLDAVSGRWPGDETDLEIRDALAGIS